MGSRHVKRDPAQSADRSAMSIDPPTPAGRSPISAGGRMEPVSGLLATDDHTGEPHRTHRTASPAVLRATSATSTQPSPPSESLQRNTPLGRLRGGRRNPADSD